MAICRRRFSLIILILVQLKVDCYEKTLRKIVRNQSKMVQRPFSDRDSGNIILSKSMLPEGLKEAVGARGYVKVKAAIHKYQHPKISTILSSVEANRSKTTYSVKQINRNENSFRNDLRLARNTFANITEGLKNTEGLLFTDQNISHQITNRSHPGAITVETFYEIPSHSKFFPSMDEQELQNVEQRANVKENTIIIPENRNSNKNNSLLVKSIFIAKSDSLHVNPLNSVNSQDVSASEASSNDKVDFLIEGKSVNVATPLYNYNISVNPYICTVLRESSADIDAQEKFVYFNIEPTWMSNKHYWNSIFDSRYESLMRNPKWPPLKVILIPRTHVDTIWKRTFDQYHNKTVFKILSNIVKKLQFYSNLTFTWNEVSHLSQWWKTTSAKSRSAFRRLVRAGRLEITTGGWVEPDEGTTHLFGLIHQLIEGHQWLKVHLNYMPQVAWLTNSVTHGPTMAYLLSASSISNLVFTNIHYAWEEYLAEYQYSDFIWLQSWDSDKSAPSILNSALNRIGNERFSKHSILTHYLQYNSAGFQACGPNKALCLTEFNFAKSNKNLDVHSYNIKEKSELLLEQYSKTGTISSHNVVIAPLGGPYRFEFQTEFDYQFNNYLKMADYVNVNQDIYKATIEFGTPKDYFTAILEKQKTYPTLKGDFLNFADINDGSPAYWTGFFTSRPFFKILLRRLESTLRTTEILFSFGVSLNGFQSFNTTNLFQLLIKSRETVARLLDRNVVSGTLSTNTLKYAHKQILKTVKDCWYIQEVTASLMSKKPNQNTPYLQKYVYREGEFISVFRTVSPGDQIYVFNSLSHDRTEIIELTVRSPNIRIVDHNKKDVTIQINPVWNYNSDNLIKISRQFFKIIFAIIIPPMTFELYKVKATYDATQSAATLYCVACIVDEISMKDSIFPFSIKAIDLGDIQLESYKYRLIFDELTGFLKAVVEKATNIEKTVVLDYGAFRSSSVHSGMFLFNTNNTKPIHDILMPYRIGIKSKVVLIVSGQVTTELTSIYGRFLQSTIRIFNLLHSPLSNAIYIESKIDYEVSPKNRELELFLSIKTDIGNGNPPEIFTDSNGFQYTARILNLSRRIESNMYPLTTMVYLQDGKSRLTFITDHAQGVTALQEGQLVVMLDRRVLFKDGRGTNEGLADSSATCHRNYILLENFIEISSYQFSSQSHLQLPSLTAVYLANSLNYVIDIFIIDRNQTDLCYYAFLPLIRSAFPCDIAVINYRVLFNRGLQHSTPNTALMIIHRQGISCQIDQTVQLQCNGDNNLSLKRILHNVKKVYKTNLVGIDQGIPISNINRVNLPSMELMSLRIHF